MSMDKKKELIKKCRYYKGEEKCPKSLSHNGEMIWFYELAWVNHELNGYDNRIDLGEYIGAGLRNFCGDDGVPMSLKALLFNRFMKWVGDVEGFKKFYFRYYGSR